MNDSMLFCCPVCQKALIQDGNVCQCANRHSFDRAAKGYWNLLPVTKKRTKNPGDNREMVAARTRFLNSGAYAPFAQKLCELVLFYTSCAKRPFVLDAGCGEGYYTQQLADAFAQAGRSAHFAAYDISKEALRVAAKRTAGVQWAVAGSFHLPVSCNTVDCIVNIFSPMVAGEFSRVLKKNGVLIFAVPSERHLFGLKKILYQTPYENKKQEIAYDGFVCKKRVPVRSEITVQGQMIHDLFAMTPYYWKSPKDGCERLKNTQTLCTEIGFDFLIYQKQ